jgi:hypothetical protein
LILNYYKSMKQPKNNHGGAGRGQGRKPLEEGAVTVVVSTKMTEAQRDKLLRLGGSPWIRERIDKAREPKD